MTRAAATVQTRGFLHPAREMQYHAVMIPGLRIPGADRKPGAGQSRLI